MGLGNYIGGEIALSYSTDTLFYCSAGVAILSVLTILGMKETLTSTEKFSWKLLKIKKEDIYEPTVIIPSVVMMLVTFSFGAALTLAPDLSEHLGINNKGLFFSYFTMTSLVSRVVGGRLSDEFGRRKVLIAAMLIVGTGSVYIGSSSSSFHLLTGALIFGAGYGLSSPALFAWAADLAPDEFRGRGFSTIFMALEIGIGTGALLAGQIYNNNPDNFFTVFAGCGGLAFLAFVYLMFKGK
ncbi:MAG: MFS transporter, partial [Bacteroidota bacterium]